jgi:hypothetical protein
MGIFVIRASINHRSWVYRPGTHIPSTGTRLS